MRIMSRVAYALPLIAGTCWGCTGVFVRTLDGAGFNAITITFSRIVVLIPILFFSILMYNKKLFRINKRDLLLLATIGINGFVFMNICYNYSITTLSMSLASILLGTSPVFVIIFGRILFGENITLLRVICMLGALVGCVLLSGVVESGELMWSILGLAAGVASSITYAANTIALKEITSVRKCHPLTTQFYTAIIGFIVMVPFVDHTAITSFVIVSPLNGSLFLLAHALVASLLPNLLFAIALIYVDSGVSSILSSGAEPTAALLFGLFIYQEMPTMLGVIGMVIVVLSMIMLSRADENENG